MDDTAALRAERPWALDRMIAFPDTIIAEHSRVEVDPITQVGVYLDAAGHVIEVDAGPREKGSQTFSRTSTNTSDPLTQRSDSDGDSGMDSD